MPSRPLLVLLLVAACTPASLRQGRSSAWPENPCAVLTGVEVAAATGLVVTNVRRAPSIQKAIVAADAGREPPPGKYICVYETREAGDLMIIAPAVDQRSSSAYRVMRDSYFRSYPGSARPVAKLGEDAWLAAGTVLHVLVGRDLHFTVATREYNERADELLVGLARAVLARL